MPLLINMGHAEAQDKNRNPEDLKKKKKNDKEKHGT